MTSNLPAVVPAPSPAPGNNSGTGDGAVGQAVSVFGYAVTADEQPVSGVVIGFQLAGADCQNCDFYTATSDANGAYEVTAPAGTYNAACEAKDLSCEVITGTPQAEVTITIQQGLEVDVLVAAPSDPSGNKAANQTSPDNSSDVQTDPGNPSDNSGGGEYFDGVCPTTSCQGGGSDYVPGGGLALPDP